jgi:DNA primase
VIPAFFIQDLLSRTNIVDVVGRYVELKKSGINLKGLCPFHTEKSPSFTVSPSRQMYHCFGCGAHGDAVRFMTEHVGLGFVDAVKELAHHAGLVVPTQELSPAALAESARIKSHQTALYEVLRKAALHYQKLLKRSSEAQNYLSNRGLDHATVERFGLGWAPDSWRNLVGAFTRYDDPLLEQAGLVISTEAGGEQEKRYDRFRGRLMFPIQSVTGEVIGFGGRVVSAGEPKYLNSPETPVFIKGKELYGLHEARTGIRQAGYVLVVEGYMDVVALAQYGLCNAVATLGTACTEDHLNKLFRFAEGVVFGFDGDAAGRKAAKRAMEACLPLAQDTRSIRFLFLPPEHDPDSYVREYGKEAFLNAIHGAMNLSAFFMQVAQENCEMSAPEGRARLIMQAKPLWKALPEGALRQQMLKMIAREVGVSDTDILSSWSMGVHTGLGASNSETSNQKMPLPLASWNQPGQRGFYGSNRPHVRVARPIPRRPEDHLLHLLINHPHWWNLLTPEDLEIVHGLPQPYASFIQWLERDVAHSGYRPWAVVRLVLQENPELQHWIQLMEEMMQSPLEPNESTLRRVLDTLLLRELQEQQTQLAQLVAQDHTAMERYKKVYARWRELKTALTSAPSGDSLTENL